MFKGPIEIARPTSVIHIVDNLVLSEAVARYGEGELFLCLYTEEHGSQAILTWEEAFELKQQIDKWLLLRLPRPQVV